VWFTAFAVPFSSSIMPARVEYRLGSIFDADCDLLTIPVSAQGAVMKWFGDEMSAEGIPLPARIPRSGKLAVANSPNPRFREVGYVVLVRRGGMQGKDLEEFGKMLGATIRHRNLLSVAMPLVGHSTAGISPREAFEALQRGFIATAPENAVLVVSVRSRDAYNDLQWQGSRLLPVPIHIPAGAKNTAPTNADDDIRERLSYAPESAEHVAEHRESPPSRDDQRHRNLVRSSPASASATPSTHSPGRSRIFISYSHADAEWLKQLQKHLRPLQREGIAVWDDTRLKPGKPWREEIREALAAAKIAILLISPDFLASDFIATDELPPLLKAAEEEGATIIPVIVSHCRFDRTPSLSRFQAVNDPAKPLVRMGRGNRDKVFDDVARAVEDALKR
jgi:hypothetical protein